MKRLAIFGGNPVRSSGFKASVVTDSRERKYINEVMKSGEYSRFMGSPSSDIDQLLEMTSVKARNYKGQYYSFLGGKMVRRFEADFSKKFNIRYSISVNSATSGLSTALGACGCGPGDEVITTALSFNATALSILSFNSIPVFVDVRPDTLCIDADKIKRAITPKTKAIIVVHLLGNAVEMNRIMKIARQRSIRVIEDCAQAPGTKYKGKYVGTIGDIGVFSFQETKNIMTGEGGMLITRDPLLAKRARLIRNHGESVPDDSWDDDSITNVIGMNYRMTELTAALGVAQLAKLDANNSQRVINSKYLLNHTKGLPGLSSPGFTKGAIPHVFPFLYDEAVTGVERSKVISALRAEGIPVGSGYLRTMYANPIFLRKIAYGKKMCPWSCKFYGKKREYKEGDCPVAEDLIHKHAIWFYHINRPNTIRDMKDVVRAFRKVFNNLDDLNKNSINTKVGYKW